MEWNGLKFEAKPVPENWLKEIRPMEREKFALMERRAEEMGLPPGLYAKDAPSSEITHVKKSETLSFFETVRATPSQVADYQKMKDWLDTHEEWEEGKPRVLIAQFMSWWQLKYTHHHLNFLHVHENFGHTGWVFREIPRTWRFRTRVSDDF